MLLANFPERFVYVADIDILRNPANARTPPPNDFRIIKFLARSA